MHHDETDHRSKHFTDADGLDGEKNSYLYRRRIPQQKKKKKDEFQRQAEDSMNPNQFQPEIHPVTPQQPRLSSIHPSIHPADLKTAYPATKKIKNNAPKE
jgi:hypothetical protein